MCSCCPRAIWWVRDEVLTGGVQAEVAEEGEDGPGAFPESGTAWRGLGGLMYFNFYVRGLPNLPM